MRQKKMIKKSSRMDRLVVIVAPIVSGNIFTKDKPYIYQQPFLTTFFLWLKRRTRSHDMSRMRITCPLEIPFL